MRERSEQYYYLYKLSLLGSTFVELIPFCFRIQNFIFPCSCPRAEPFVVVLTLLLQILLIWARFERHNPLLSLGLGYKFSGPYSSQDQGMDGFRPKNSNTMNL